MSNDEMERLFVGEVRPPNVPADWLGEPLPAGQGWRWFNPHNRGDSVRFFRGDAASADPSQHEPYVVVTVDGELIDRQGRLTGERLDD